MMDHPFSFICLGLFRYNYYGRSVESLEENDFINARYYY